MQPRRPPQTQRARKLRLDATEAEQRLWYHLRSRQLAGATFRRQQPIGPYYADFCSVELKLVIEVDGGQHMEPCEQDDVRTAFLKRSGYRVLRFWNTDILGNLGGVLGCIETAVAEQRSSTRGEKRAGDPLT